ncbi:MAG TPA: TrkH family potassium uptake protein [Candidatus Hydrogenedentes bacterium]|nr:TrkH family potassium uptake protein [Candidatus Hydrogenedentota bacterium]
MNYRLVTRYLGHFSCAIGLLMLPSALCAVFYKEWGALAALLGSTGVSCLIGYLLAMAGRNAAPDLYQREGLGLVGLSWILLAGLGALPYLLSGVFINPADAYFECMSGFTTTGASVMTAASFDTTPKSILFWRSFTHWLGGMGIVVLFIAVLPYLGAGGKQLFKSESPGPDPRGLKPRIKDTAIILYEIYLGFTVAQTVALMLCGMSLFDALCHTFGSLATGGFSTRAASVGAYDSVAVEVVITFFMVCAGSNFALYSAMLGGNWKALFKDTEWRVYIGILALCTLMIAVNLMGVEGAFPVGDSPLPIQEKTVYGSFGTALRHASFNVASIMTTTGFCTVDFNTWPYFSRMLLVVLMFVGGCAGSTGGGIKVVRLVILLKMAYARLKQTFRPKMVRAVRVSGHVVDDGVQQTVYSFFVLYLLWFVGGSLFMSLLGLPFQTAVSSVAATLNNVGPGLSGVGAVENYAFLPTAGKVFLSLCMVLGRLELVSIMVLFMPSFWRRA